ncbi:hypothetical protein [Streptomyces sp. ALI-76-A]|uniref:hypothetical protein n=1 Tax=Streptomyces sp. ALI-76-A TaxID=3025736 RepID=UPI00256EC463|nr:hypothetical protein [Streptomyces sp. ALI-76-A]MDL5199544.1 hypothetical protein [Streptomyces sp. ALI-76-A]
MAVWHFLVKIAIGRVRVARLEIEQASAAAVLERHITHLTLRIPQASAATLRSRVAMPIRLASEPLLDLYQ